MNANRKKLKRAFLDHYFKLIEDEKDLNDLIQLLINLVCISVSEEEATRMTEKMLLWRDS